MAHCVTLQPPLGDLNFCPFFSEILFYLGVGDRVQGRGQMVRTEK